MVSRCTNVLIRKGSSRWELTDGNGADGDDDADDDDEGRRRVKSRGKQYSPSMCICVHMCAWCSHFVFSFG